MNDLILPKPLKIVQINMGNGATANDQLLHYCLEEKIDLALLQEVYTKNGVLTGLNAAPIKAFLSKPGKRRGNNKDMYFEGHSKTRPHHRALGSGLG